MKKEINVGDKINLNKKYKKHIKAIKDEMENYQTMSYQAAEGYKNASKKLWDFIEEIEPGVTKKFRMTLDHEDFALLITGKL